MESYTDEQLVQQFCEHQDKQYYEVLYSRYAQKTFQKALSYVRNTDDAEDVIQNVWVKVFFNLAKFRGQSKFSTWLYRITVNESISHLRKRKTYSLDEIVDNEENSFEPEDPFADFLSVLEHKDEAAAVLAHVSVEIKSLLLLKFAEGYTYDEIADTTGLSRAKQSILSQYKKI